MEGVVEMTKVSNVGGQHGFVQSFGLVDAGIREVRHSASKRQLFRHNPEIKVFQVRHGKAATLAPRLAGRAKPSASGSRSASRTGMRLTRNAPPGFLAQDHSASQDPLDDLGPQNGRYLAWLGAAALRTNLFGIAHGVILPLWVN